MRSLGGAAAGVVVACDVGGTGIKAGLVDKAGRVHRAVTVPTPVVDGDGDATAKAILDQVAGLISELAATGVAIVLVSSEIPEVLGLSDRVLVLREGRVLATRPSAELTEADVLDVILEGSAA